MNQKTIYIAEDERAYGEILRDVLEKEGYKVTIALDGDELLKLTRVKTPELIVLDLIMPIKNGFEVLAEMKRDKQLKTIPVIALSNLGQEEDMAKVKSLGAKDYIVKSDAEIYDVIGKIKKLLN